MNGSVSVALMVYRLLVAAIPVCLARQRRFDLGLLSH